MSINLLAFAALVLVPIIPAFLFFKFIRSRAKVSGSLSGMTISLGGAFGGYFALMLFLTSQFGPALLRPTVRVWRITGEVQLARHDRQAVKGSVNPPLVSVLPDGRTFSLEVPVVAGSPLPHITLQADNYEPRTINLDELLPSSKVKETPEATLMNLTKPIVMEKE